MIIAVYVISGASIVISGTSLWLARISVKIRRGKPLNNLESWVVGKVARP